MGIKFFWIAKSNKVPTIAEKTLARNTEAINLRAPNSLVNNLITATSTAKTRISPSDATTSKSSLRNVPTRTRRATDITLARITPLTIFLLFKKRISHKTLSSNGKVTDKSTK